MRKHRKYVVGYPDDARSIHGKSATADDIDFIEALTLWEVETKLKEFESTAIIYELVPIKQKEKK